uniref:Uncharacterized protein n=1 Tax=Geospiza parvula TaxID=87175 RepID=A0A8U8BUU8_GEOPR
TEFVTEAQRLLTVSVWKLYRCRVRRGGLRLHRSLQLSLLVRAARHRYLSARAAAGILPGPEISGAARNGASPVPEIREYPVPGAGEPPGKPPPVPVPGSSARGYRGGHGGLRARGGPPRPLPTAVPGRSETGSIQNSFFF